jgi:hypothetical protein
LNPIIQGFNKPPDLRAKNATPLEKYSSGVFLLTQTLLFQVEIIQQGYNGSVPNSFVAAALQSCGFES